MNDLNPDRLHARSLVAQAWREVLGAPSLERNEAFDEAGDSLKFMHFMLLLERAAGRSFSMGAFHSGLRPSEIAALIETSLGRCGAPELPLLFLFHGIGGNDPQLAKLAVDCEHLVRVKQIVYPRWTDLLDAPDFDFAALRDLIVAQVKSHNPRSPVLLAGYSFGGIAAYAAASALRQAGHEIGFLGLLDSDALLDGGDPPAPSPAAHRAITLREEMRDLAAATKDGAAAEVLARIVVRRLKCPRWRPVLRLTARVPRDWLPRNFGIYLYRDLLIWHLLPLLRQWQELAPALPPLESPAFLFRADDHKPGALADLGWNDRCRNLTVIAVPGTHLSMLQPENLYQLRRCFSRMVRQSLTDNAPDQEL